MTPPTWNYNLKQPTQKNTSYPSISVFYLSWYPQSSMNHTHKTHSTVSQKSTYSIRSILSSPHTLIIGLLIMIASGRRTARQGIRPEHAWISSILMIGLSSLTLIPLIQDQWYRWWWVVVTLGLYALCIESIGITTGYPYGAFEYGDILGYKLWWITPRTVFFGWTPLVISSYYLATQRTHILSPSSKSSSSQSYSKPYSKPSPTSWSISTSSSSSSLSQTASSASTIRHALIHLTLSTLILVSFDFVLDPGAIYLGMRSFVYPGVYYQVPRSNFGWWIFSGVIGRGIIRLRLSRSRQSNPLYLYTTLMNMVFWTVVCRYAQMRIPVILGVLRSIVIGYDIVKHRQSSSQHESTTPTAS